MYDTDRDGFLTQDDFERLLRDVHRSRYREVKVFAEQARQSAAMLPCVMLCGCCNALQCYLYWV